MELQEVLDLMKQPEKLVDPNQIVVVVQHISEFITHYELEYYELKLKFSMRWEAVKYAPLSVPPEIGENGKIKKVSKALTDKQTEIRMMQEVVYKELMETKRRLGELKRYRSDLNRRLDIIMGIKRRSN